MFGSFLDGIPVVGHVKGVLHYAAGDKWGGDAAMKAATRTTAVMAGGAAGIVGGPAGVIAGATGAGLLVDTVTSAASGRPQGVIGGISDIVTDLENGEIPIRSVVKTGLFVGADALSGLGGGSLVSNVGGAMGKSMARDAAVIVAKNVPACQMVAGASVGRELANNAPSSYPKSRSGGSGGSSGGSSSASSGSSRPSNPPKPSQTPKSNTGSGSGSQPPKEPADDNKKDHQKEQTESHLDAFLGLFRVKALKDIKICNINIFEKLESGQLNTLKALIKKLRKNGLLMRVVKTVLDLFNELEASDVTFQNFLSLAQFVASYIGEEVGNRTQAQRGSGSQGSFESRREENLESVAREVSRTLPSILSTIRRLCAEISGYSFTPNFRNVFAAMYHYFKHRVIPQTAQVLTVEKYIEIIKSLLERVRRLTQYGNLTDATHSRRELVFDRTISLFGNVVRIRIVLKIQDGNLELSSCYILDDDCEYNEGLEFIDPDKKRD